MADHILQALVNTNAIRAKGIQKPINFALLFWSLSIFLALNWVCLPAQALEVRGTVVAVEEGSNVRIDLPAGAVVAVGDEVRIETELPNIGPIAIQTRWRVIRVSPESVIAEPEGTPTGAPLPGYAAIIETSESQTVVNSPQNRPVPKQECDRLAAFPRDPFALGAGVALDQIQAAEAITACRSAMSEFPDTPRFVFQLGRAEQRSGDLTGAMSLYRKAADMGYSIALNNLGFMYLRGVGVEQDCEEALRLYRRAADENIAIAMGTLGEIYLKGCGDFKDPVEAVRWFRRAANSGSVAAMTNLGFLYEHGTGVEANVVEAAKWYRRAAELGSPYAMQNLAIAYDLGRGVDKDHQQAVKWYRMAADGGRSNAMYSLAISYEDGQGVAKNPAMAAHHMMRALRAGNDFSIKEMTTNANAWSRQFRRELQKLLKQEGLYQGAIDGKFGPGTNRAFEALANR